MQTKIAVPTARNNINDFWKNLPKPFFILAPMDDVTDTVFREVVNYRGAADVNFTEFANTDGYVHPKGTLSVRRKLQINNSEHIQKIPVIAQLWGAKPDHYFQTAKELAATGLYAGIDINMGCPERGIVKRGCCGGLIKHENWQNAANIIQSTKSGAGGLPVSVKTRIGVNNIITEEWVTHLLNQDIAALTIHGRSVKEMSKVPAHWDEIGKAVKVRNKIAPHTIMIGNGDVESRYQGEQLAAKYKVDGIMIGRGIFKNLHVFSSQQPEWSLETRLETLIKHVNLYQETWEDNKSFEPLKKFFKVYLSGFPGAAEIRNQFMQAHTPDDARSLAQQYLKTGKALEYSV